MSKRRRLGASLVVLVLLLVGVVIAADRIAVGMANRMIAKETRKELQARQITVGAEPTASVGGFPFLTQVASGRYDRITIKLRQVTSDGVTLPALDLAARDVKASISTLRSGSGRVTAGSVNGTATIDWTSAAKLVEANSDVDMSQIRLSHGSGDQIRVTAPLKVGSISTKLLANGMLVPDGDALRMKIVSVSTEGALPPLVSNLLNLAEQQYSFRVKLPALPYGMKVTDVHPTDGGLQVTAAARQVPLSA